MHLLTGLKVYSNSRLIRLNGANVLRYVSSACRLAGHSSRVRTWTWRQIESIFITWTWTWTSCL